MENIVSNLSSNLSKIWTKIKNIENSLFPELQEQLGILSSKEEKLIKILDYSKLYGHGSIIDINPKNCPDQREEMPLGYKNT